MWFERIVERALVNGSGRLSIHRVQKPMRKIGAAMRRRVEAADIVKAMILCWLCDGDLVGVQVSRHGFPELSMKP